MGAFDHARIRGVDAGHVGPDLQLADVQGFSQQGGAVVAAAAAQGGGLSLGVGADEALSDDIVIRQQRRQLLLSQAAQCFDGRGRLTKTAVGAHHLADIKPNR